MFFYPLYNLIFHQIYTKNQIFIYFLIPYLGFLLIYYLEKSNLNNKNFYNLIIIILCIFVTLKYCIRYDLKRRFHELEKVDLSKGIDAKNLDKKLSGLKNRIDFKGYRSGHMMYLRAEDLATSNEDIRKFIQKSSVAPGQAAKYK